MKLSPVIAGCSRFLLLIASILLLVSCEHTERKTLEPELPVVETEEYAVYRSVIESQILPGHSYEQIVVGDSTNASGVQGWTYDRSVLLENLPALEDETLTDAVLRNDRDYPLENRFGLDLPVSFIADSDLDEIFTDSYGWVRFYRRYQGSPGILGFSRVGFNDAGDQALLYLAHLYGFLGAEGYAVLMTKQSGSWEVADSFLLWIS